MPIRQRFPLLLAASMAAACFAQSNKVVIKNQGFLPFADAPIHYRSQDLNDPIARLQKQLNGGQAVLQYDPKHGYLKSVLDALRVPVSSQTLVFSKTSFQFPEIAPATPRALYYNDDVYVGRVQNGKFLEFVSFDPLQGAIFYVLDEHQTEHPQFERAEGDCVQCHVAPTTHNVPGVLMRSVLTKPSGYPAAGAHVFVTGHESPMNQRWGGWYVTGVQGAEGGMGNALAGGFQNTGYLTSTSDIVALLVLAHQTQMHNLITQVSYQTRLGKPFESSAEQLVRYLLFINETPLENPVTSTSEFAKEFAARGLRDSRGRSLRDFDLHTRIFKYPCSYLVYSDDFDTLPQPAKDYVYRRLFEVLNGQDQSPDFASLKSEDRQAILEILAATKPGLPAEWKQSISKQNTSKQSIRASASAANH